MELPSGAGNATGMDMTRQASFGQRAFSPFLRVLVVFDRATHFPFPVRIASYF